MLIVQLYIVGRLDFSVVLFWYGIYLASLALLLCIDGILNI